MYDLRRERVSEYLHVLYELEYNILVSRLLGN